MNGVINIYKEKGYTSHDVVAKLRGILKMKRIGHTGTLDPEAEGVLPVCLGSATKLCDMLTEKTKSYRATIRFGIATDTEDMTGQIVQTLPVTVGETELKAVLKQFIGSYEQIPPMYSAIKIDGKKLYELARAGKIVERKGRPITIYSVELHSVCLDEQQHLVEAEITVTCGKGTYIRSLCRDIGEALATCACMKSLIRTKSGNFELKQSIKLSDVEYYVSTGEITSYILPVEQVFQTCAMFIMKTEWNKLLHNGNPVPFEACEIFNVKVNSEFSPNWFRAYDSNHQFLGIYEKEGKKFIPVKMFLPTEENKKKN